jgi:hypothetical protein
LSHSAVCSKDLVPSNTQIHLPNYLMWLACVDSYEDEMLVGTELLKKCLGHGKVQFPTTLTFRANSYVLAWKTQRYGWPFIDQINISLLLCSILIFLSMSSACSGKRSLKSGSAFQQTSVYCSAPFQYSSA